MNLGDGLLGWAQRTSLLTTTNEPIERLHLAVRCRGRCTAEVELPVDVEGANRWLRRRSESRTPEALTIAQPYVLAGGYQTADPIPARTIGFAAALAES